MKRIQTELTTDESAEDKLIRGYLTDGNHVGLACAPFRIGITSFIVFLEHRHFKPETPANDDFQLILVMFMNMVWSMVIIPKDKLEIADALCAELGLKRVAGVPRCCTGGKWEHWPFDLPTVYTLENVPGHFVYHNDTKLNKTAKQMEDEAINKFFADLGFPIER